MRLPWITVEELQMLQKQLQQAQVEELKPCLSPEDVWELQRLTSLVKVAPSLQKYMLSIVRATRTDDDIIYKRFRNMSNVIIELLTIAIIAMALRSKPSQEKTESVMIPIPINDQIRKS